MSTDEKYNKLKALAPKVAAELKKNLDSLSIDVPLGSLTDFSNESFHPLAYARVTLSEELTKEYYNAQNIKCPEKLGENERLTFCISLKENSYSTAPAEIFKGVIDHAFHKDEYTIWGFDYSFEIPNKLEHEAGAYLGLCIKEECDIIYSYYEKMQDKYEEFLKTPPKWASKNSNEDAVDIKKTEEHTTIRQKSEKGDDDPDGEIEFEPEHEPDDDFELD